ncbi:hypothetical protein E2562_021838 [Oryza meyeriana var. granulata]|uniref:Uncharacterized protein n=1 Tax=Oryza meyeriana var. granulata TaxID=110450 RepID=A0A6G1ENB5_9ORYZ|nr:hypothetical protein E2562_021838 [Oryza meyeriana var. granulata]
MPRRPKHTVTGFGSRILVNNLLVGRDVQGDLKSCSWRRDSKQHHWKGAFQGVVVGAAEDDARCR